MKRKKYTHLSFDGDKKDDLKSLKCLAFLRGLTSHHLCSVLYSDHIYFANETLKSKEYFTDEQKYTRIAKEGSRKI